MIKSALFAVLVGSSLTLACWSSGAANAATPAEAAAAGIEPYCVPWPIPVDRHPRTGGGSSFSNFGQTGSMMLFEHWRQPCGGTKSQIVLAYTPLEGSPFVCGGQARIMQNGMSTSQYRLVREVDGSDGGEFCGVLTEPTGLLIHIDDPDFQFNDDEEFEFYWDVTRPNDLHPGFYRFVAGPFRGDPLSTGELPPHGDFSGSYFDPERAGEGALIEVGQVDERKVLQVSWYTYDNGQPLWIYGVADFAGRDTRIQVPLQTFSGARFGQEFSPSDVSGTPWGEATISFTSCQHMNLDWVRQSDGEQGQYRYQRTVNRLLGSGCSNESPTR